MELGRQLPIRTKFPPRLCGALTDEKLHIPQISLVDVTQTTTKLTSCPEYLLTPQLLQGG